MGPQTLLEYVSSQLDHAGVTQGFLTHKDGGTVFLTHPATTQHDANVYRPLLCAVLQGAKEVGTSMDLSRFDAAPLIAFTATKEMNYGTETDGRIS